MATVMCEMEYVELPGEHGNSIQSVMATCTECGNETESYGTSGASVRRCLVVMREECPHGSDNWYEESW